MNDKSLIIQIRNRASEMIDRITLRGVRNPTPEEKGRVSAYKDILNLINTFYEDQRVKEEEKKREKLSEFKNQLKSLYTELERELDAGRTWSANEVNEEIHRLKKLIDELQNTRKEQNKPIGRKLRIEL